MKEFNLNDFIDNDCIIYKLIDALVKRGAKI